MSATARSSSNVKQVVPFFRITDMDRSLRFYVDGLGFTLKNKWVVDNQLRWCWLELGGAALMLQTFANDGHHVQPHRTPPTPAKLGEGVSRVHARTPGSLPRIHFARIGRIRTASRKLDVGDQSLRSRRLPPGVRKPHRCPPKTPVSICRRNLVAHSVLPPNIRRTKSDTPFA